MKFIYIPKEKINSLPTNTGVYAFQSGKELFYIGKATNIKERVKNHFQQPTFRDDLYINKTNKIGFWETNSEIEALILEAELIKKLNPKYNVLWKDDKNYSFVVITKPANPSGSGKEELPRVFITHQPQQEKTDYIGPFVDSKALKRTLAILRRIFPYYVSAKHPTAPCQWCHLGLCPGPNPNKKAYKDNIKNLSLFLKGKKPAILKNLKKEMQYASTMQNFETAAKARDKIISLERIILNAKVFERHTKKEIDWKKTQSFLQEIIKTKKNISRIETYDISNIQGKMAVGSMVVFIDGLPAKQFYRKFKIKMKNEPNDFAMIQEVLNRRFKHPEWPFPDLLVIDGGKPQLSAAKIVKKSSNLTIPIVAIAKRHNELFGENKTEPLLLKDAPQEIYNLILHMRDEAHRFAITYHRKLREKSFKN